MKRALLVALVMAPALLFVAPRATAQVPTLPTLQPTTTVPAPPETTDAPTTTTVASTTTSEATTETSVPDTIPAVTDTSLPLSTPTETTVAAVTPPRSTPKVVSLQGGLRAAAVTGAYGIGLAGVLAIALLLVATSTVARSHLLPGGTSMNPRRRARLIAGIACIAAAAIVGIVGYLKLSLEPDVNRQIPYLASAGMALVLLAAVGGAFLVGEQMRTDEQRIEELEAAVEKLAAMVAPEVEAAPRTRKRAASRRS